MLDLDLAENNSLDEAKFKNCSDLYHSPDKRFCEKK